MNGQNLLIGLSHIDRKFVEESENDTVSGMKGTYEKSGQGRNVFRKPLLIAAIIALMLLLMGCAAIFMSVLFDSPKEMISALYGENTGFDSALPTEVTDPWKPDSAWTVPGYEKQPVEETVSKELEKWVTPVGQSIEAGGNKLTVDAFLYDSVTRSGLITVLLEHSEPLNLAPGHNGLISENLVDINQYGYAYMIPEKTTDTQLAFTYYFRMDRRQGDILIVSFPEYEEMARADALEALREEEIPKIRQRIMGELTLEEAAQKCQELYGFSGYTGQYDDYYFLAAYEFDSTHAEESTSQYTRDLSTIEQSLKNDLTPEEAVAKLKELWGEELMEETMSGREQEEIEVLAYAILAERIYDQTHTENKIFVQLREDISLPNKTFGDGAVLVNSLCVRVSNNLCEEGDSPDKVIFHMKDGSSFVIRDEVTDNTLYALAIEHGDVLYMLNSAINIDNIQSVEIAEDQSGVTLEVDT